MLIKKMGKNIYVMVLFVLVILFMCKNIYATIQTPYTFWDDDIDEEYLEYCKENNIPYRIYYKTKKDAAGEGASQKEYMEYFNCSPDDYDYYISTSRHKRSKSEYNIYNDETGEYKYGNQALKDEKYLNRKREKAEETRQVSEMEVEAYLSGRWQMDFNGNMYGSDNYFRKVREYLGEIKPKDSIVNEENNISNSTLSILNGKSKDECPIQEMLYKSIWYMVDNQVDFYTPSKYHYDDTKILYIYPVVSKTDYSSFIVLNQDSLDNQQNTILFFDFCQFKKNEDGSWSRDLQLVDNNNNPILYIDNDEKQLYEKAFALMYEDIRKLYITDANGANPINTGWYFHGFNNASEGFVRGKNHFATLSTKPTEYYTYKSEYTEAIQKQKIRDAQMEKVLAETFANNLASCCSIAASLTQSTGKDYKEVLKTMTNYEDILANARIACPNFNIYYPGYISYK